MHCKHRAANIALAVIYVVFWLVRDYAAYRLAGVVPEYVADSNRIPSTD